MSDSTVVIDVIAQVTDATEPGSSSSQKNVSKLEKSMTNLQKQIQGMKGKSKLEVATTLKDMASKGIQGVVKTGKQIAGKVWTVTLKAIDLVTAPFKKVLGLITSPVAQAAAFAGISFGLADTINTFKDFEQGMANVKAISGASGEEFEALQSTAKQLGETTQFSAAQAAEAMENLAMAGWKSSDIVAGMPGLLNLAAAGSVDLATASDVTASALAQFKLSAEEAGRVADVLAATATNSKTDITGLGESLKYVGPLAGSLGYSIEDVSVALGVMGNAAIDGSSAGTALRTTLARMTKQEGLTAEESNAVVDAMRKLGVSMTDENGKAKSLMTIMRDLRAGYAKLSDSEKAATMANLAGQNAMTGMLAICDAAEEDFNQLEAAINNSAGAAQRMADVKMDTLQGSLYYLQSAAEGVKIAIGEKLQPYVKGLVDWVTAHMPDIQKAVDEALTFVISKIDRLKSAIKDMTHSSEWENAGTLWDKIKVAWDKLIVEPFTEWWNGTGKAWLSGKATEIGEGLGSALHTGIMALLGVDVGGATSEGMDIGKSFADAFVEAFKGAEVGRAIWEAIKSGIKGMASDALKLLPGGEEASGTSGLSAAVLGYGATKIGGTLLKGAKTAKEAISLGGKVIGDAGAGTALGTGMLSLGSIAGGIVGGVTIINGGMDVYRGFNTSDKEEASAYKKSGATKIGLAGTGALMGAMVGSAVPIVGTAAGALIGAGLGGLAGLFAGNTYKKDYKAKVEAKRVETEKSATEKQYAAMTREAEREETLYGLQKIMAATGRSNLASRSAVKFENSSLSNAAYDRNISADQFTAMFQSAVKNNLNSHFGDISLSTKEIGLLANDLVFSDQAGRVDAFTAAVRKADTELENLSARMQEIDRMNWEAELGVKLSDADIETYKKSMEDLVSETAAYLKDKNYEADMAVRLLIQSEGADNIIQGFDSTYAGLQAQLDEAGAELQRVVSSALKDGVISTTDMVKVSIGGLEYEIDEATAVTQLQNKIAEITNQVSTAEEDAKLQSLKIRYGGAQMDMDSFSSLQEELQSSVQNLTENYNQALEVSITNLNLELADGAINQEQYDAQIQELTEGYAANIKDLQVRVESFQLDTIADAYSDALDGILPGLTGSTSDKLKTMMNSALATEPDPVKWTEDQVSAWFGLGSLGEETRSAISGILKQTAASVPNDLSGAIVDSMKSGTGLETAGNAVTEGIGTAIENADMAPVNNAVDALKSKTDTAVDSAFQNGINTTMPVRVTMDYEISNPTKNFTVSDGNGHVSTKSITVTAHAEGGILTKPHVGLVAEDGAEAIIPLSGKRREHGIQLWRQAGEILGIKSSTDGNAAVAFGTNSTSYTNTRAVAGDIYNSNVQQYANGGIVGMLESSQGNAGGSIGTTAESDLDSKQLSITDYPAQLPYPGKADLQDDTGWQGDSGGTIGGDTDGSSDTDGSFGYALAPQVTIQNLTLEVNVDGGGTQNPQELVETIRENVHSMTDEIAYQLAIAIQQAYANTPRTAWGG